MNKLIIYPMQIFNSPTLAFPCLPWSITGMECTSWDKDSGHGGMHPLLRNTGELLPKEQAEQIVSDYVKWYKIEHPVEISYEWKPEYDTARQAEAKRYAEGGVNAEG